MIVYNTSNILAGPLVLLVWAIDIFFFLCLVRVLLGHVPGESARRACAGLEGLTDPVPRAVKGWLAVTCKRPLPAWLPWALFLFAAIIARQLLAWALLRLL